MIRTGQAPVLYPPPSVKAPFPAETSMRCAFTQRLYSATSEAIIGPMSSGRPARASAVIAGTRFHLWIVADHAAAKGGRKGPRSDCVDCDVAGTELAKTFAFEIRRSGWNFVEKEIDRSNPAVAGNDEIRTSVSRRLGGPLPIGLARRCPLPSGSAVG